MWWYEAPVSALSFNDNCILLRAWGASQVGRPAILDLFPRLPMLELRNGLRTSGRPSQNHWRVQREPHSRQLLVTGDVYRQARPFEVWVTVEDPVRYFGAALRDALAEEGVTIAGRTLAVERLPGPWWEQVAVERTLLLQAIEVANKRSQNFYAESVFKLLGAELCGEGSWQGGQRAVEEFVGERLGWSPSSAHIVDGSGMSRENRQSAHHLVELLTFMFHHRWGLEFLRSLPFSGEEGGTLHQRLDLPPYRGNVFAKTGTLTGVSSLSGYAKGASGHLYAFSILCDRAPAWRARQAQDSIVRTLVDHG